MEAYTIAEALLYLNQIMELDDVLSDVWITGEVSRYRPPGINGHHYFTIKDEQAAMDCVMWRSDAIKQKFLPTEGAKFLFNGYFKVYEVQGKLQFYIQQILPAGIGELSLAFENLKRRLEDEGLFAIERKRAIPAMPRVIGLVTSPQAAAYADIINVLRRRYPLAQVVLSPTLVQGENAPPQIVAALQAINQQPQVEVVIVARGGGAMEDLWCFNDERVARAIFASRVPVVTGVGHEIDFTIADFVADLRAPTPSAAAELVSPSVLDIRARVSELELSLYNSLDVLLDEKRTDLEVSRSRLRAYSPASTVASYRQRVDDILRRSERQLKHSLQLQHARLQTSAARLQALNPTQILERGYAVVTRASDGEVITDPGQVSTGDAVQVLVSKGKFSTRVIPAH